MDVGGRFLKLRAVAPFLALRRYLFLIYIYLGQNNLSDRFLSTEDGKGFVNLAKHYPGQTGPGRIGKQGQEQTSRNHVQDF